MKLSNYLFYGAYYLALKSVNHNDVVRSQELKFYSLYALTYLSLFTTGYLLVISFLLEKIGCYPITSFREDFPIAYAAILLIVPAVTILGYFLHNNKYIDIISCFDENPNLKKKAALSWVGYMAILIVLGMPVLYFISPG